jgi:uncharacterized protein YggU (UPF0235/DUF167 family)
VTLVAGQTNRTKLVDLDGTHDRRLAELLRAPDR